MNAATTYITTNASTITIDPASPALTKARIVANQKYIANTEIDPLESFLDENRLHFLTDNSYISTTPGKV